MKASTVYGFESDVPTLWMDAQAPQSAVADKHILWPVWAYTVLAPRVAPRPEDRLDVFQEAVLRLLRADVRDPGEIASLLHLDRRLVAYIRVGLHDDHLCDDRGVLTERGARALRDADPESGETCMGFVFQDPMSRTLWGRFVERLAIQDVEWRGELPVLMFGSAGSPRPANALAIPPKAGVAPMTPRAADILDAVRRHRRAVTHGADEELHRPAALEPENIQRISVVSEDPMPVWLGTTLYATDIDDEAAAWNVADPFGIGTSPVLRAEIARRAEDLPALRDALRRLVKPASDDDTRSGRARRVELARMDLQERFGPALGAVRELDDLLVDLVVAVERAADEQRPVARADAMVRAQRALEGFLGHTLPFGRDENVAIDLIDDQEYDAAVLDDRARAIGFEALPRGMRFVQAAKIRAALRRGVGSLRPLALANLLCAATDLQHVFHGVARQKPALLNDLDVIASVRDRSAHAGGEPPRQDELERIADDVLDIVEYLFSLVETSTLETSHAVQ